MHPVLLESNCRLLQRTRSSSDPACWSERSGFWLGSVDLNFVETCSLDTSRYIIYIYMNLNFELHEILKK